MGSYKKKLSIALLLILFIGFFVCGSVNASSPDSYNINVEGLLQKQQELLANVGLRYIDKFGSSSIKENFDYYLNNISYYPIFSYSNSGSSLVIYCTFVPYNRNWANYNNLLVDWEDEYFEDTYILYPCSGYQFNYSDIGLSTPLPRFTIYTYNNSATFSNYSGTFFLPSLLILYQNQTTNNYKGGITPSDNVYLMIMQSIQENTEQEEEATNEMKKLNDFMKSDDVDDESFDMPGNNDNTTNDVTSTGIDNIFNIFYNEITGWQSQNITVRIPFTNKFFYIPANLTENIIDNFFPSGAFKNLLGLIWYYLLSVYIIKDVEKYVEGLQTGEILTKSDTNIKTEML